MKKILIALALMLLGGASAAYAADKAPAPRMTKEQNKKMAWWRDAHFGMFIHWGPYAQWGGVYNDYLQRVGGTEWIMNRCKIPVAEYQAKAKEFNPVDFDADAVVKMARDAGMKYLVFTTKHHDGFAMFQSDASPFNIVDFTPYKRDVVADLVKACEKYGLKFGIYYSQLQDWNNGGTTGRRTMDQGWPNPEAAKIDAYTKEHNGSWDPAQQMRTYDEYFDEIAIAQLRELLTRHGKDIHMIFWDTPSLMKEEYAAKVADLLKEYPHIITNDRLIRGNENYTGDYKTPEQAIPTVKQLDGCDWETNMTLSDSWGHKKRGVCWKTPRTLITNLIDIVSKGGNFLLNIAPDETGAIPPQNVTRLAEVGKWMDKYGESIYGTERMRVKKPDWGYCTQKILPEGRTKVYIQVIDWPEDGNLLFRIYENAVSARLLDSGKPVQFKNTHDGIYLTLPKEAPDEIASVIELEFDKKLPRLKRVPMNTKNFEIVDAPSKKH